MVVVQLPGTPFQAVPTHDGCYVFVSLVGPVEPGDPRRPPEPGAPKGGVAVVSRIAGDPSLERRMTLEGSPYGMVLTHDERLLIVASDDRVIFVDSAHALLARVPVGDAPVGIAVWDDGRRLAVANSNRFGTSNAAQSLTIIDTHGIRDGTPAVMGHVQAGVFPRELTLADDQRTLLLTNSGSKTLVVIDISRLMGIP